MTDSAYYRNVFQILSGLSIPTTDTNTLRAVADIMDETALRGNAAKDAEERAQAEAEKEDEKAPAGDVA